MAGKDLGALPWFFGITDKPVSNKAGLPRGHSSRISYLLPRLATEARRSRSNSLSVMLYKALIVGAVDFGSREENQCGRLEHTRDAGERFGRIAPLGTF